LAGLGLGFGSAGRQRDRACKRHADVFVMRNQAESGMWIWEGRGSCRAVELLAYAVSDRRRFCGVWGIDVVLVEGIRLSRSIALPGLPFARKSRRLGAIRAAVRCDLPEVLFERAQIFHRWSRQAKIVPLYGPPGGSPRAKAEVPSCWRRGVNAAPRGWAPPFFACGVPIKFDGGHGQCCTADWWDRECAVEAVRGGSLSWGSPPVKPRLARFLGLNVFGCCIPRIRRNTDSHRR